MSTVSRVNHICRFGVNQFCRFTSSARPRCWAAAEKACAKSPGKRVGNDTLRHSFAKHMVANGVPLNQLQAWLGHESLATTEVYLRLASDTGGRMTGIP